MNRYERLVSLLAQYGYDDIAVDVLQAAAPLSGKALALKRMEAAFKRGGISRLLRDTERRIQKTKDSEKLRGVAEAIEAILRGRVRWVKPHSLQQEDIEDFGALSSLALKKAKHKTTVHDVPEELQLEEGVFYVIRHMLKQFKNRGVQSEISGRLQTYSEHPIHFVYLYNSIFQTGVPARDLWVTVEDDPLWKIPPKHKIQLIKTQVPVFGRIDILVVDAWVDRKQGVGYIRWEDHEKVD